MKNILGGRSPIEIFHTAIISGHCANEEDSTYLMNPQVYGIDYMGPLPQIETDNNVVVPNFEIFLSEDQTLRINNLVPDPLANDGARGINFYIQIREVINFFNVNGN